MMMSDNQENEDDGDSDIIVHNSMTPFISICSDQHQQQDEASYHHREIRN